MKIAVFCPNWVGDMVMATPTLRALRSHFPRANIVGVMRPYVTGVVEGLDLFDRLLLTKDSLPLRGRAGVRANCGENSTSALTLTLSQRARGLFQPPVSWDFVARLRAERFDLALLLPNSFRSALWAWISGARRRIGYDRNGRRLLLTDAVRPPATNAPRPVIDDYLRLAAHLGCRKLSRKMELATTSADERRLDDFWDRQAAAGNPSRPFVCLNPGGAFGSAKHWPASSFAELARRIAVELDKNVLVLCGPAERTMAREIAERAGLPRVVSLSGEPPSIGLTKAGIRRSDLLITTDSGPRHFAPPFGVPVVTLFGPTHAAWSETFYNRSLHLQTEVDCGPCQMRVCPLGHHRCMRDLTVEWVFKAATTMLEKFPGKQRAA